MKTEQEKAWAGVFAQALGSTADRVSVKIEEGGWVRVSTMGTPTYAALWQDHNTVAELAKEIARLRLHDAHDAHEAARVYEDEQRRERVNRIRQLSNNLSAVIINANALTAKKSENES